ncbi:hypothetical protein GF343_01810 [Candidatus Woesearchaeota archaeon]|nr:hypothetical protein [Candidatus Woesearchaeota archaeon]
MKVTEAYTTLEKYFSEELIAWTKTKQAVKNAENSWMKPAPWFNAAAAHARDNNQKGFKKALHSAANCYEEIIARYDPEKLKEDTKLTTEAEAADTLARNVEEAWELVKR